MTPEEVSLMTEHAGHWEAWRSRGHVRAFGLVADPAGPYGVGIVEFEDEAGAQAFISMDPVITSNRGFRYDVFLMPFGA